MFVQRQGRATTHVAQRRMCFDGVVVGGEDRQAAVGDPLQQLVVAAVEHGAGLVEHRQVGLAAHVEQLLRKTGVQTHHVAALDGNMVGFEHAHQRVVADRFAAVAQVRVQVDHHAAALHAALGHVLDAERACLRRRTRVARLRHAGVGGVARADHVFAGTKAVVVDRLGHAVGIGVEHLADVREAVPLGRILQVHHDEVVAEHVGLQHVVAEQAVVHVRPPVAQRRPQHRRVAARIQHVAAGIVERQAEAKRQAFAHFGDTLLHLLRRQQIDAAALVVCTEVAPVRAGGALLPARFVSHQRVSS